MKQEEVNVTNSSSFLFDMDKPALQEHLSVANCIPAYKFDKAEQMKNVPPLRTNECIGI